MSIRHPAVRCPTGRLVRPRPTPTLALTNPKARRDQVPASGDSKECCCDYEPHCDVRSRVMGRVMPLAFGEALTAGASCSYKTGLSPTFEPPCDSLTMRHVSTRPSCKGEGRGGEGAPKAAQPLDDAFNRDRSLYRRPIYVPERVPPTGSIVLPAGERWQRNAGVMVGR